VNPDCCEFKGLGGVGNAENKFVASLIPGYRP